MSELAGKGKSESSKSSAAPESKTNPDAAPQFETASWDMLMRSIVQTDAPIDPNTLSTNTIMQLQRQFGNQNVMRILGRQQTTTSPLDSDATKPIGEWLNPHQRTAESIKQPDVRFRVPEFERIKAALEDKDLKIPEAVIKDRVAKLLGRMQREGRLKSKDDIPTIIGKIFPAPGKIDEAAFNDAVDVSDRSVVYKNILDAFTQVKSEDKAKLKKAIDDAVALITNAEGNAAGLKDVFGSKDKDAITIYKQARSMLVDSKKNMEANISTDYNLDDTEVGLGGWASHGAKHMHLLVDVVKVTDEGEAKITLIHEAAHLADPSVDDKGYYGTANFEALDEDTKITNAAHFEEIPRRELGISSFAGKTFTPGVKASGGKVTREDNLRQNVSEHLRMAWDAAVDAHSFIRDLRLVYLKQNSKKAFRDNKPLIMEMSKLMDLTLHTQAADWDIVTTLDVTLTESIARAMVALKSISKKVALPKDHAKLSDDEVRDQIVAAAVVKYGNLLNDPARDKALIDWLVAHYRSLPGV